MSIEERLEELRQCPNWYEHTAKATELVAEMLAVTQEQNAMIIELLRQIVLNTQK